MIKYYINGVPAIDVARKNGISGALFTVRVCTAGWSVEDACTKVKKPLKTKLYELEKKYGNKHNLSFDALRERLRNGCPEDKLFLSRKEYTEWRKGND